MNLYTTFFDLRAPEHYTLIIKSLVQSFSHLKTLVTIIT